MAIHVKTDNWSIIQKATYNFIQEYVKCWKTFWSCMLGRILLHNTVSRNLSTSYEKIDNWLVD